MESNQEAAVFHYDPETLLYFGSGYAHLGPTGDVQLPAFSTAVAPGDTPAGKVARATAIENGRATAWDLIDDHRSTPFYATSDGSQYVIGDPVNGAATWDGVGEVPAGLTPLAKPDGCYVWDGAQWSFDIASARVAAAAAIDARCDEVLAGPFSYNGHQFAADIASIQRLASVMSLASIAKLANEAYSVTWPSVSGDDVQLDADGVMALGMAAANRLPVVQAVARQLKTLISAAGDEASLAAIVWPQQGA